MKRIGRSKSPTQAQLETMASNLEEKFGTSSCVSFDIWAHKSKKEIDIEFNLSFVPGFNRKTCSQYHFKTWDALLDKYYHMMKHGADDDKA